jgi:hypothetical protein
MRWICSDEHSELRYKYCPAEPATSSMDIAGGCWHLPPHGLKNVRGLQACYISLSTAAHVLVTCYSVPYIGQDYNAGRRKSSASSGLPHQKPESCNRNWELEDIICRLCP